MKKIISLALVSMMLLAFVACGAEEKTIVYTGNLEGAEVEYTMTTEGDKVKKIVQTMVTDISEIEEDVLDDAIEMLEEQYNSVSGITYTATKSGTELHEKITMDFSSKAKIKAISELGLVDTEEEADYISLKMTRKNLEKQGLSEK